MDVLKFEKILIQKLFVDEEYRDSIFPFIKPKFLITPNNQLLIQRLQEYVEKYTKFPTTREFRDLYVSNEDIIKAVDASFAEKNDDGEEWNHQLFTDKTEDFFKTKMMIDSIGIIGDELSAGNEDRSVLSEQLQELMNANAFCFDKSVGLDVGDNADEMFEFLHSVSKYIPTGIASIDRIIGGGSHDKTLNVIMAQPNLGKTLIKCAIGVNALLQNKKVLYITHEMAEFKIAERFLCNLFDVDLKMIYKMAKGEFLGHFQRVNEYIQDNLVVKEYPTKTATTNHIRALCRELKEKRGFVPDIMFNDYMGITMPNVSSKNSNSYNDVKNVSEELRGLAVELEIPIWTSIQTNRGGMGKLDTDMSDMADSTGPSATADVLISATQSEDMKDSNEIQLNVLKNRYGENMRRVVVKVDYGKMRIEDYDEQEEQSQSMQSDVTKSLDTLSSLTGGGNAFGGATF